MTETIDISRPTAAPDRLSLGAVIQETIRRFTVSRRGLIIIAIALVIGGLAANWGWMIALGVAPVILSLAPCALMCAVGLCSMKFMGGGAACADSESSTASKIPAGAREATPLAPAADPRSSGSALSRSSSGG